MSDWDDIRYDSRGRPMYYGRKGEPLSLKQWAEYGEDIDYKRVAYDEIPATTVCAASFLSTVWLGLDHSFILDPTAPPVIFETMRFELVPSETSMFDNRLHRASLEFPAPDELDARTDQARYSTEEQASLGHKLILRLIQEREMQ